MQVEFKNGEKIDCEGVFAGSCFYQGVSREMYTFLFPKETSLSTLDNLFTEDNCDYMTFHTDDGESFVHEHFTIRRGIGCSNKESALGNAPNSMNTSPDQGTDNDPEKVFLAWVQMAQSTLTERKLIEQQDAIDTLIISQLTF